MVSGRSLLDLLPTSPGPFIFRRITSSGRPGFPPLLPGRRGRAMGRFRKELVACFLLWRAVDRGRTGESLRAPHRIPGILQAASPFRSRSRDWTVCMPLLLIILAHASGVADGGTGKRAMGVYRRQVQ